MRTLIEKLNVPKSIAGFGVPMGATMNMSGAAICIVIATVFVANAYGMPIAGEQMLPFAFMVLLLSVGTVAIGVCLHQFGLPIEALAIIAAVARVCDIFCTTANVAGDSAVNTIVAKSENAYEASLSKPTIA